MTVSQLPAIAMLLTVPFCAQTDQDQARMSATEGRFPSGSISFLGQLPLLEFSGTPCEFSEVITIMGTRYSSS